MPRQRPYLDVDQAAEDYRRGWSLAEVADAHRVSTFYVRTRLIEAGVALRPKSVAGRKWRGEV